MGKMATSWYSKLYPTGRGIMELYDSTGNQIPLCPVYVWLSVAEVHIYYFTDGRHWGATWWENGFILVFKIMPYSQRENDSMSPYRDSNSTVSYVCLIIGCLSAFSLLYWWAPLWAPPGGKMATSWYSKLCPIVRWHTDLYQPILEQIQMCAMFMPETLIYAVKSAQVKNELTVMPIWQSEYDLPGNFIDSFFQWGMVVTPYRIGIYGHCMGNSTEINDFPWKIGFHHFKQNAYFGWVHDVPVKTTG